MIIPGFAGHPPTKRATNDSELFTLFPRAESGTEVAERSEPADERPAALYPKRLSSTPSRAEQCTADIREAWRSQRFAKPSGGVHHQDPPRPRRTAGHGVPPFPTPPQVRGPGGALHGAEDGVSLARARV